MELPCSSKMHQFLAPSAVSFVRSLTHVALSNCFLEVRARTGGWSFVFSLALVARSDCLGRLLGHKIVSVFVSSRLFCVFVGWFCFFFFSCLGLTLTALSPIMVMKMAVFYYARVVDVGPVGTVVVVVLKLELLSEHSFFTHSA